MSLQRGSLRHDVHALLLIAQGLLHLIGHVRSRGAGENLPDLSYAAADQSANDQLIVDQVRIKLSADAEVKGGALSVDCNQGVVTLGGTVESSRQKDKAAKLAKKVKGVKQVVNNIEVKNR